MNARQFEDANFGPHSQAAMVQTEIAEIYAEMFELLEDYAPSWYTEDLHYRAGEGLHLLKRGTAHPNT
jgi:hypothetical protein